MPNFISKGDDILLRNSKILIVDDDRSSRLLLRKIFENFGFEKIEEAENGEDGLQKTLQFKPDLVLLDINMPVMDGFTYCKKIKEHQDFKDLIILAQTGLSDLKNKAKIFDAGVTDYVTKPLDLHEISARSLIHLRNAQNLKELNEFSKRVKKELKAAKNLLEASLPDLRSIERLEASYNIDLAAKFESSQELGGDFWGICNISDSKLAIYIIDISGHGIDSALGALRIHSLIMANIENTFDPAKMLSWLNQKLVRLFPAEQYATMFFGVIDIEKDLLSYATAATPSPILMRKDSSSVTMIPGKGFPVGAVMDADFEVQSIPFHKGDTLILYSDAITEALMENGQMFGEESLVRLIEEYRQEEHRQFSSKTLLDNILTEFHAQCGKKVEDDLTFNIYHRF